MGGEVHLDIYDDRLTVTSPGGMYNGALIQNLDITDVSSEWRNPILADVMAQLDYMEKRGSGLKKICLETKALNGYADKFKPVFKSTKMHPPIVGGCGACDAACALDKDDVVQNSIFEAQLEKHVIPHDDVAILNAFPMFLYYYFPKERFAVIDKNTSGQ